MHHFEKNHLSAPKTSAAAAEISAQEPLQQSDSPIVCDAKCEICYEYFPRRELLQSHICGNGTTKIQKISCEYCAQSFSSIAKCMQHLADAHSDDRTLYKCRECTQYFGIAKLKDLHEKYYPHPIKPFQCDMCSRKFPTKHLIQRHMEHSHTSENK